jgi:hypothetical protein
MSIIFSTLFALAMGLALSVCVLMIGTNSHAIGRALSGQGAFDPELAIRETAGPVRIINRAKPRERARLVVSPSFQDLPMRGRV